MSAPNINISNGTCYTAAGQRLGAGFIPCGNDAYGRQTCCGAGDNCLANGACFGIHGSGYGSYLTYFAGCTDQAYKDTSCPNKRIAQPWVALTLCDNSDGAWAVCSQQGNPSTLQPGSFCSCTNSNSATVAFKDATVLANIASLPQSAGQSVSFWPGRSPTTPSTPNTTPGSGSGTNKPASNSGGSSIAVVSTSTPISTSTLAGGSVTTIFTSVLATTTISGEGQGRSSSKLGAGAIAGITIGGVIAILLLIVIAILLSRRKPRRSSLGSAGSLEPPAAVHTKQRASDISTAPSDFAWPNAPSMPEADSRPVSEVMGKPADPWTLRNELDGKEVGPVNSGITTNGTSASPPMMAELPGSELIPRPNSPSRPAVDAVNAPRRLRVMNE